jgi:hypothetical protein
MLSMHHSKSSLDVQNCEKHLGLQTIKKDITKD